MRTRLALLALPLLALGDPARTAGGPTWHDDLDEAFALAAESGRPLLIVFR